MPLTLNGTTGVSFVDSTIQTSSTATNRIINGAMVFDQRNAGASVTPTNGQYLVDRFAADVSQASKFTAQQSSTAPTGFTNSLLITSSSAYTVGAGDYFTLHQFVEGFNTSDFAFGTASATTITLSFWVRSSLTGTFGGSFRGASNTRSYPFTYTISTANTWEYETITIVGDTSGTWLTNNGIGIGIFFGLGVGTSNSGTAGSWQTANLISATGAVSVVGTSGATFYITGVQLEKATSASSFGFRQYTEELALCQRYFEKSYEINVKPGTVTSAATTIATFPAQYATYFNCTFQASKRSACTMTGYSPSSGAAGNQSQNMTTDIALNGFISNGLNQACCYSSGAPNTSNYLHFTADAEL